MTKFKTVHPDCKIPLGWLAVDKITELRGVVSSVIVEANGNWRVIISPKAKDDGTLPDSWTFDQCNVDVEGTGPVVNVMDTAETDIEVLNPVKSTVSDFRGIVTQKVYNVNGCVSMMVVAKKLDDRGRQVHEYINANQLIKDVSMTERLIGSRKTETQAVAAPTGGPATRAPRF